MIAPMSFGPPRETYARTFREPTPRTAADRVLPDKHRCGLCATTNAAHYAECDRLICFSEPVPPPSPFKAPRPLVSAFELAGRMRAKALSLDWDSDDERTRLLGRAKALETGDHAEVADEDV